MGTHPEGAPVSGPPASAAARPADLFEGAPRSAERIDRVLALVRQEWLQFPDERFFQLVTNLADRMGIGAYASILEDDALIALLGQRTNPSTEQGETNGVQE